MRIVKMVFPMLGLIKRVMGMTARLQLVCDVRERGLRLVEAVTCEG